MTSGSGSLNPLNTFYSMLSSIEIKTGQNNSILGYFG